jgi:hypothetical protein
MSTSLLQRVRRAFSGDVVGRISLRSAHKFVIICLIWPPLSAAA